MWKGALARPFLLLGSCGLFYGSVVLRWLPPLQIKDGKLYDGDFVVRLCYCGRCGSIVFQEDFATSLTLISCNCKVGDDAVFFEVNGCHGRSLFLVMSGMDILQYGGDENERQGT